MGKALGARWVGAGTVLQWSFAVYLTQRDFFQVWSLYEHKIDDEMIVLNPFVFFMKTYLVFILCCMCHQETKCVRLFMQGPKLSSFSTDGWFSGYNLDCLT